MRQAGSDISSQFERKRVEIFLKLDPSLKQLFPITYIQFVTANTQHYQGAPNPTEREYHYSTKATRSVDPNTIPPTASGKLYPTVAPTLLFVVEVVVEPALEPVFVGAAPAAVVVGFDPCDVCEAPTVETPGGTVPPGQFVGGGALFD
jgi:hypothetical protein